MAKIQRTKLLSRQHDIRNAMLFVIATEGKETEKQYFENFGNSKVKIEILPTGDDNKSAPQYVLDRLNQFQDKYDINEDDELWLVFDVDRWKDKNLSSICKEATQKRYYLAISKPCFEVWLCLHFDNLHSKDRTCEDFQNRLKLILAGYRKNNVNFSNYQPYVQDAIQRGKELDKNTGEYWPSKIGTHVYKLVENIVQKLTS
jgi:hypothetical protein